MEAIAALCPHRLQRRVAAAAAAATSQASAARDANPGPGQLSPHAAGPRAGPLGSPRGRIRQALYSPAAFPLFHPVLPRGHSARGTTPSRPGSAGAERCGPGQGEVPGAAR